MGKLHNLQKHLQEKDSNDKSLPRVERWATVKILVSSKLSHSLTCFSEANNEIVQMSNNLVLPICQS